MTHTYNLRNKKEFKQLLSEIFPSKGMSDSESDAETEYTDSDEEEEEEDEEEEEEEDEEEGEVNITFTVNDAEPVNIEQTDKFIEKVSSIGSELEGAYKDLPMFKTFIKMHKEMVKNHETHKKKLEEKERKENETSFDKLICNKPISDLKYFKQMDLETQRKTISVLTNLRNSDTHKPDRIRLLESSIPDEYKLLALQKVSRLNQGSDGDNGKNKTWLEGFMKIPFGVFHSLPVSISDGTEKCHAFMEDAKKCLDECTYGLNDAKMQILQYIGQLISNPKGTGTVIAIEGPMGTGKTTLIKEGVSKILKRPFAFVSLGGAQDSSLLDGHMITYEGSVWGQIVDILMRSKCMNPVIYFDELDKVSGTPKGEEIIGILTHLTDSTQNQHFRDNYFSGIDLDLSRATLVFSYNNKENVNTILGDRMNVIKTTGYTTPQKVIIATRYLSKHIRQNISFNEEDVIIPESTLSYIIETYTCQEKGVRNLKRCLETIYAKLNLFRLMNPGSNLFGEDLSLEVKFPITLSPEIVRKLLKIDEQKTEFMMYL